VFFRGFFLEMRWFLSGKTPIIHPPVLPDFMGEVYYFRSFFAAAFGANSLSDKELDPC
jgi:hypothetical protein